MLLGIVLLKKSYSIREYISIVFISIGICLCTLASASEKTNKNVTSSIEQHAEEEFSDMFWWAVGILMLTLALVLSAIMGLIQEKLYTTHGKCINKFIFFEFITINRKLSPEVSELVSFENR